AESQMAESVFDDILQWAAKPGKLGETTSYRGISSGTTAVYGSVLAIPPVPQPERSSQQGFKPTADQTRALFKRIRGRWRLDFTRGQETATIEENGDYSVDGYKSN